MSLAAEDVKRIANLAQLTISGDDVAVYTSQLSSILHFIEQLESADTTEVQALAHPLDISQRLRPDQVTEPDLREKFQQIAPHVEAGLYLVPKVIEEAS